MAKSIFPMVAIVLTSAAMFSFCSNARSENHGDLARGHAFAQRICSGCHAVEIYQLRSPVAEAPPFATFSRLWPLENLEKSLAEGIMVGHEKYPMPVFQLGPPEIADLIAYLRTIQEPDAATPQTQPTPATGN